VAPMTELTIRESQNPGKAVEQLQALCFPGNGVEEIESEWTARDRELKMFCGPPRDSSAQISVQKTDANLGTRQCVTRH